MVNNIKNIVNEEIRNQFILNERNVGRRKKLQKINETTFQGKTLISVDIQPEYEKWIYFDLHDWVEFINSNAENNILVFLYNGAETLSMVDENEYRLWLFDLGIEEDVLDHIKFYDKGYAFFRTCMDSNIDVDNIVDLVQYMIRNDINDSRDIDEDMWNDYMETTEHNQEEVRELLENAGEMINVPDLMDFLKYFSNIVIFGGGIDECLKEVEIALLALNKNYDILNEYVY
jgi:hypothetical protein